MYQFTSEETLFIFNKQLVQTYRRLKSKWQTYLTVPPYILYPNISLEIPIFNCWLSLNRNHFNLMPDLQKDFSHNATIALYNLMYHERHIYQFVQLYEDNEDAIFLFSYFFPSVLANFVNEAIQHPKYQNFIEKLELQSHLELPEEYVLSSKRQVICQFIMELHKQENPFIPLAKQSVRKSLELAIKVNM